MFCRWLAGPLRPMIGIEYNNADTQGEKDKVIKSMKEQGKGLIVGYAGSAAGVVGGGLAAAAAGVFGTEMYIENNVESLKTRPTGN